jgi:ring-1,2-phenylacetyl-CoA epoxidase subunit PaaB
MSDSPHPRPLPEGEGATSNSLAPSGREGAISNSLAPSGGEGRGEGATREWPLWEVFVRSKQGLEHKHCGSLHAVDARQALQMARDVYTRRMEGVSIWVVPSALITASEPQDKAEFFDPAADKIYRHPSFYEIPDEVGHM